MNDPEALTVREALVLFDQLISRELTGEAHG